MHKRMGNWQALLADVATQAMLQVINFLSHKVHHMTVEKQDQLAACQQHSRARHQSTYSTRSHA